MKTVCVYNKVYAFSVFATLQRLSNWKFNEYFVNKSLFSAYSRVQFYHWMPSSSNQIMDFLLILPAWCHCCCCCRSSNSGSSSRGKFPNRAMLFHFLKNLLSPQEFIKTQSFFFLSFFPFASILEPLADSRFLFALANAGAKSALHHSHSPLFTEVLCVLLKIPCNFIIIIY